MENKTVGETIAALRREKHMTQKELADKLGITDKAVSKWERDLALPDTATIPKLAKELGISLEALMQAKADPSPKRKTASPLPDLILKAIPTAMGVAVTVLALLGQLDMGSGFAMLGLGLACVGIQMLRIAA